MAKFYQTPTGDTGLRYGLSLVFPIPAAAEVVEFDEAANPELMNALCGRNPEVLWQEIEIVGGGIVIREQPVTINPPQPVAPTMEERVAAVLEWADRFRAALQTSDSVEALKIEDAKHPKLPENESADIDAPIEINS
jgi:hypothetical protein